MTTGGATTMGGGTPILTSTPRSVGIDNVHPQNVNATATSKPFMLLPPVSDFAMYPIGDCHGLFELGACEGKLTRNINYFVTSSSD
jgi:hypothetical protein